MPYGDAGGYTISGYQPPVGTVGINPSATNQPVTAPADSLLQKLQMQRQGATQYGSIAQGMQNPDVYTLLAAGLMPGMFSPAKAAVGTGRFAGLEAALSQLGPFATGGAFTFLNNAVPNQSKPPTLFNRPMTPQNPSGGVQPQTQSLGGYSNLGVRALPGPTSTKIGPGAGTTGGAGGQPQYATPSYGF